MMATDLLRQASPKHKSPPPSKLCFICQMHRERVEKMISFLALPQATLDCYAVLYNGRVQVFVGYVKLCISFSNIFGETSQLLLEFFNQLLSIFLNEPLLGIFSQENLPKWTKNK